MGLFKKKKNFKDLTIESYKTKSLQELTSMIGGGLKDKNDPATIEAKFWLAEAYLEKLVATDIAEGGFGYKNVPLAIQIMGATQEFEGSVYDYGTYKRKSGIYGEVIQNYRIEFLKNYLLAGNDKIIRAEWFRLIFKIFDDTLAEETDDIAILTKEHLEDQHCPLYNPWVYQGKDDNFIIYKINVAILLCSGNFVKKYGLFKKNELDNTTAEYITFDDLLKFDNKTDLEYFLDDCQTIDN